MHTITVKYKPKHIYVLNLFFNPEHFKVLGIFLLSWETVLQLKPWQHCPATKAACWYTKLGHAQLFPKAGTQVPQHTEHLTKRTCGHGGNQQSKGQAEATGPCSGPSAIWGLTLEIRGLIKEALKVCPHVESLDLEFLSVLHFLFSFLTF